MLFYLASTLATLLKFSGAAVAVGGVGYFGFHFIAENGRSAQRGESAVPAKAWQGAGARKGLRIIGVGVLLLIASFLVALVLKRFGAQAQVLIDRYFNALAITATALFVGGFVVVRYAF